MERRTHGILIIMRSEVITMMGSDEGEFGG